MACRDSRHKPADGSATSGNLAFMAFVHIDISVRGFTEAEARNGLPDLVDEFQQRHWLFHPTAVWDVTRSCLAIGIGYEGHDMKLCERAVLDEVQDCVVACLQTASDIHFEIDDSRFIPAA
jgi:hypothetical protein